MKLISLKLPEEVATELDDVARGRSMSRSRVIREAVAEYLGRSHAPQAGSALALAGDLVGSVDGPGDLTTNPAHLEGYGQ